MGAVGASVVGASLVWVRPALAQLPPLGIKVGDRFPEVPLMRATDGSIVSISDFSGQKLVLHVFASW